MSKRLFFAVILCTQASLLTAQNIAVSLEIESHSPFITSVDKVEMERKILDSVILSCQRQVLKFTDAFRFYNNTNESEIPDYRLELVVIDTALHTERFKEVHAVIVHSILYQAHLPKDSIRKLVESSGVSYGFDSSAIIEPNATTYFFSWPIVQAKWTIRNYLPLSLNSALPAKNFSVGWLSFLEYYKDIGITIAADSAVTEGDVSLIRNLVSNIFLVKQDFYYHATRKEKAYFNYFFLPDVVPPNAMHIRFVISEEPAKYIVRFESDDKSVVLPDSTSVSIPKWLLQEQPSRVNKLLSTLIGDFIFKNL